MRITFRHLWNNKLYSAINITGLAIGISCVILAVLYWQDERSYDTFHGPDLYRITTTTKEVTTGGTGQVQGPAFAENIPEIVRYTRVMGGEIYGDVVANDKAIRLQFLFADDSFLKTFSFTLLRGNASLTDIGAAVITESTALKYFNSLDVIGKLLHMEADPSAKRLGRPMVITGVVKDPPKNSSIRFDALFPISFLQLSFEDNSWESFYLGTYVTLRQDANLTAVMQKMDRVHPAAVHYGLQRMTDIHLAPLGQNISNEESGVTDVSSPVYSYMFLGIAIFILLMAGINFVNISLASSLKRAKEVGVRKIIGGSRFHIIRQFLEESAILCLLAFVVAVMITWFSLPVFNQLTGKQILLQDSFHPVLICSFAGILSAIILLTGLYPAKVLSNFKPIAVLYNSPKLSGRNLLGRSLVVLQFSLAVFLLIATLVYYSQMDFIRTKDLGYNPMQVIRTHISGDRDVNLVSEQFRQELSRVPAIETVSFGGERSGTVEVKLQGRSVPAVHRIIDENFLAALEIPLKTGRNLSTEKTGTVLVNEAFVKAAGLADPIGVQIRTDAYFDTIPKTIVGVVKDYHYGSLRESIQPLVMFKSSWYGGGIWVKFKKEEHTAALTALQKVYTKILPQASFQYDFLYERNAKEYAQEAQWQQVIRIATLLSVFICSLGLFGLAHLSTRQRFKEIGIRKVLGASVQQIVTLLTADFLKLVMIAFIIATPFAWMVMNNWLEDFAYRIHLGAGLFLLAGGVAILMAFIAVSIQSIAAAMSNPVKSLRSE
ncbi:FtsX-like permease family protein [Chitinophaga sp. SYP-B3965]|uniref:ABC transporter permease n=1 Tax=Chitinophaga sp. SYP-B3965 TaxID=2663120 RepID=UPI0012995223|nr:ABC transporter permease [Chitinophaga sp. SYP-B3965]MRG46245.1 FtsX-like permease family protein [Chitinophaga sp. SYP-B3965]